MREVRMHLNLTFSPVHDAKEGDLDVNGERARRSGRPLNL